VQFFIRYIPLNLTPYLPWRPKRPPRVST